LEVSCRNQPVAPGPSCSFIPTVTSSPTGTIVVGGAVTGGEVTGGLVGVTPLVGAEVGAPVVGAVVGKAVVGVMAP